MCCMDHAFTGSNFLSIVLKIVEGDTPSLPERYPRELNTIMESMLNKNPSLRPSALEILKNPYIAEQLQHLMCRYSEITLEDKNLDCQKEAARIINAIKIVEDKYEENNKRMQELRSRNFQQLSTNVLHNMGARQNIQRLEQLRKKEDFIKIIISSVNSQFHPLSISNEQTEKEKNHLMGTEEKEKQMERRLSCSPQQEDGERQPGKEEELDEPASENLPESQPTPSLDFDSSREEAITDLEHNGMCLHQLSSECLAACSGPCQPLKEALIVCDHSLSACQHWAMTRLKNRLTKHFFPLYVLCNSEHSWKLTPGGGPSLNGLHAIIIDLTLKQCRTDSEVQFPSLIDCSPSPYKFILKK
ncbi:serine/threonine-protein kinase Nek11 isoform X2 [Marmota monax]|uniref:serine/threonine-protein kinase Nek11 isoform X2 n=1 Tax=Marmota monax TaxID=9995 RepID=UPI001EAFE9EC|nr:serine/threonine-protein kinase Nek11 isoform X2 [Marmota monax]